MKTPKLLIVQKLKERISKLSYRQFLPIIVIFCCLLFLAIVFLFPEHKTKKVDNKKAEPKIEMMKVVTANRDIAPQTVIREDMLQVVSVPKNLVPDGAVTDTKMAINLPAAIPIQKGDVLTNKKFYSDIRMAGFPGKIPDDCRAISVAISDVTGVAGFAKPGDHVDIMTISGKRRSQQLEGKILLQNVLLLGINKNAKVEQPKTQPTSKDEKKDDTAESGDTKSKKKEKDAEPGSTAAAQAMANATLALTPSDALKLAVAAQNSTIYLALRPVVPKETVVLDTEYVATSNEEQEESAQNYEPAPVQNYPSYSQTPAASVPLPPQNSTVNAQVPAASTPAPPASSGPVVEVIRGTESTMVRSE